MGLKIESRIKGIFDQKWNDDNFSYESQIAIDPARGGGFIHVTAKPVSVHVHLELTDADMYAIAKYDDDGSILSSIFKDAERKAHDKFLQDVLRKKELHKSESNQPEREFEYE